MLHALAKMYIFLSIIDVFSLLGLKKIFNLQKPCYFKHYSLCLELNNIESFNYN